jgi:hypothetical protein
MSWAAALHRAGEERERTVQLVGGISAVPWYAEGGCAFGVIALSVDHQPVGTPWSAASIHERST